LADRPGERNGAIGPAREPPVRTVFKPRAFGLHVARHRHRRLEHPGEGRRAVRPRRLGTAALRDAVRRVEINSSFYRPHRRETWERWADSVPADFRFAVKMPKTVSHERKLVDCGEMVARFLDDLAGLGDKLAILLLQLPPKLAFDPEVAEPFLAGLAGASPARLVCEPRHPSWFEPGPDAMLARLEVARVAADPAIVPAAALPGGWRGLSYWRLHGSPRMYRSSYDDGRLDRYAALIREESPAWCIFDNSAASAATGDALGLISRLAAR
jgi:uncharacterized protein YecE (DUF72 family)